MLITQVHVYGQLSQFASHYRHEIRMEEFKLKKQNRLFYEIPYQRLETICKNHNNLLNAIFYKVQLSNVLMNKYAKMAKLYYDLKWVEDVMSFWYGKFKEEYRKKKEKYGWKSSESEELKGFYKSMRYTKSRLAIRNPF